MCGSTEDEVSRLVLELEKAGVMTLFHFDLTAERAS
jgi:hypothetical protein